MGLGILLFATALSFISVHSNIIGKQILKWINKPTSKEKELTSKINDLKKSQECVSITENFSKYSKIQRQINKIEEELSNSRNERNNLTIQLGFAYGPKVLLGFLLVILSIYYRSTPIITLDNSIDLTPFSFLISYPHGANAVSFHFWILCSSATARLIKLKN
ncbi:unnamed protein product [Diabrotica balteata]|uniref:Guided entry of tail-anchored proteins factor 1 n=1 Tax=Diabrotica balteata TaxID=107213 RepID=A0A9N9XHN3_DIABA|nr:unnamed protein product [Diabrotica balteata]